MFEVKKELSKKINRIRSDVKLSFKMKDTQRILIISNYDKNYKFPYENKGNFNWNGNIDLIADTSGSMSYPLSYDEIMNEKNKEKWLAYPRIKTQEFVYKEIRKKFPKGKNYVFSESVYEFKIENEMVPSGGTDLQKAIDKCDPNSITIIFTDDKGGVNLASSCNPIHKMVIVVLLTSYSLDNEYNPDSKDEIKNQINKKYKISSGSNSTDPKAAPSFGTVLLSQRDSSRSFIQIESSYNEDGTKLSDQKMIIESINNAINHAIKAEMIYITNTYKRDFILQCPSGTTLSIPSTSEKETKTITYLPLSKDFGEQCILYTHLRKDE